MLFRRGNVTFDPERGEGVRLVNDTGQEFAVGLHVHTTWDTKKIHKGGFYHDGRFATLADVVNHYDNHFQTNLTEQEKADLIEYLKSI